MRYRRCEPRGSIPQTSPSARPHGPVTSAAGVHANRWPERPSVPYARALGARPDQGVARVEVGIWAWVGFVALIVFLLALDLFVFHREAHEVSFREATKFSIFWISLG